MDSDNFNKVTEGKATILFPKEENVFYNPIQQFNRDLSVTAIKAWADLYLKSITITNRKRKREDGEEISEEKTFVPKINIIEALSATGLRAIRYANEIPNVGTIIANDLLPDAVENIDRNIEYNLVRKIVQSNLGDANQYMYANSNKHFQVIDLDPYGSAAPFIDSAIQAIDSEGLLLVTCTDLAVLAGNSYPEKCFALYGGSNLNSDATHESALRLVLNLIATTAAKHKRCIVPLLSLLIDFYVRLFIKVATSPIQVKRLASNSMVTYLCSGCKAVHNQPLGRVQYRGENNLNPKYGWALGPPVGTHCRYCDGVNHICGPMWAGPLHNKEFAQKLLDINETNDEEIYKTKERIKGMVTLALQELDVPFYFSPPRIASILKIPSPSINALVAGLGNCGFQASLTHAHHGCIKTDANWDVIWEVCKKYVKKNNLEKLDKMNKNTFGYKIMTRDIKEDLEVSFEKNDTSKEVEELRKVKIVRFQMNPAKNWGPKGRPSKTGEKTNS